MSITLSDRRKIWYQKNNLHLQQTKTADQTPHYGLRKLSVGVASVLLSTTLYLGATAQAEKVNQTDEVKSSESAPTAGVKETSTGTVANKTVEAENNVKADSHAKTAELPQTGNEQTNLQAVAGLAMTGLAAMLGLGRKKRKNS